MKKNSFQTFRYILCIVLALAIILFYSSASYSAFFRQFSADSLDGNLISQSIFYGDAISEASAKIPSLLIILCIPFAFLWSGYSIHMLLKEKSGITKIVVLVLISFIFNFILAYEITEKIYDLKIAEQIDNPESYSVAKALTNVGFWAIIITPTLLLFFFIKVIPFKQKNHFNKNSMQLPIIKSK